MLSDICTRFAIEGRPISCGRYGNGHINETYLVETTGKPRYILQKINHRVFKDVPRLMNNIAAVTRYLARKDSDPRHVLTIVPTLEGDDFLLSSDGSYWRMYIFVEDSICLEGRNHGCFYQSAVAFGQFQNDWLFPSLPKPSQPFTIHPAATRRFKSWDHDSAGRLKDAQAEVNSR